MWRPSEALSRRQPAQDLSIKTIELVTFGLVPWRAGHVAIATPLASPAPGSDRAALRAGEISITPIAAARTAGQTSLAARRWNFLTRVDGPS